MVVVDSRRVPRVPRYSGTCQKPHRFRLRGYHPLWPAFPGHSANGSVGNFPALNRAGPSTPRDPKTSWFGLFRVRSPLLTESLICFLFLRVLRWFTSPSSLLPTYEFSREILHFLCRGFPHSEIPGSTPVCGSPRLIAACHVLHRHLLPRHPPCALSNLTIKFTQSTSAASGRMLNFRSQACAWWRLPTINCQRNSMTYAPVHRGTLI